MVRRGRLANATAYHGPRLDYDDTSIQRRVRVRVDYHCTLHVVRAFHCLSACWRAGFGLLPRLLLVSQDETFNCQESQGWWNWIVGE